MASYASNKSDLKALLDPIGKANIGTALHRCHDSAPVGEKDAWQAIMDAMIGPDGDGVLPSLDALLGTAYTSDGGGGAKG